MAIVTAVSTLIFGLFATILAVQQWQTNKRKLKTDLFHLRWPIFVETAAFLRASHSGELTAEQRNAFLDAVVKSEFLYGKEMHDYLDGLHIESAKIGRAPTPEKIALVQKHWDELGTIKDRFRQDLDLTN